MGGFGIKELLGNEKIEGFDRKKGHKRIKITKLQRSSDFPKSHLC